MKTELTQKQRDAIHQMIRIRLGQIDSIPILLDRDETGAAETEWLNCRSLFCLLDEIGWPKQSSKDRFEMNDSDSEVTRAMRLVREQSLRVLELAADDRAKSRTFGEQAALITLRAIEEASPNQ